MINTGNTHTADYKTRTYVSTLETSHVATTPNLQLNTHIEYSIRDKQGCGRFELPKLSHSFCRRAQLTTLATAHGDRAYQTRTDDFLIEKQVAYPLAQCSMIAHIRFELIISTLKVWRLDHLPNAPYSIDWTRTNANKSKACCATITLLSNEMHEVRLERTSLYLMKIALLPAKLLMQEYLVPMTGLELAHDLPLRQAPLPIGLQLHKYLRQVSNLQKCGSKPHMFTNYITQAYALGEVRTHNEPILSRFPLPIGIQEQCWQSDLNRQKEHFECSMSTNCIIPAHGEYRTRTCTGVTLDRLAIYCDTVTPILQITHKRWRRELNTLRLITVIVFRTISHRWAHHHTNYTIPTTAYHCEINGLTCSTVCNACYPLRLSAIYAIISKVVIQHRKVVRHDQHGRKISYPRANCRYSASLTGYGYAALEGKETQRDKNQEPMAHKRERSGEASRGKQQYARARGKLKNKASSSSGWLGTTKKFLVARSSLIEPGKLTRDGPRDALSVSSIADTLKCCQVIQENRISDRKSVLCAFSPLFQYTHGIIARFVYFAQVAVRPEYDI